MACSDTWEDIGETWITGSPFRHWDNVDTCTGEAVQFLGISDALISGFAVDVSVSESIVISDSAIPFVNNWDTCDNVLADDWVEETPFDGSAGDCNE